MGERASEKEKDVLFIRTTVNFGSGLRRLFEFFLERREYGTIEDGGNRWRKSFRGLGKEGGGGGRRGRGGEGTGMEIVWDGDGDVDRAIGRMDERQGSSTGREEKRNKILDIPHLGRRGGPRNRLRDLPSNVWCVCQTCARPFLPLSYGPTCAVHVP